MIAIPRTLGALALLALASCGGEAEPVARTSLATPVTLAPVEEGRVAQPVAATGTFGPKDEITLSFKIGGILAEVRVDEGALVQRGTRLATIDLREIDAMLAKATVAVDKATRDEQRIRALYADSVATLAQLQDVQSAREFAEADARAARVNRQYAEIVAPTGGRILRRRAQPGALVAPGQEILTLGSDARGRVVRVGLPDRDAVRTAVGQEAQVTFDAMPGRVYTGRVSQRGAATDARTGTVPVEISVRGADQLPAGTVAHVTIAVPASVRVTLIPIDALVEADGDSATVFSVLNDRAVRHRVRVLFLDNDRVAVDGLTNTSRVVTNGAPYLSDSTPTREVKERP